MNKPFPLLATDDQIEALMESDLSLYLTPENLKRMPFEREAKSERVNMRLPKSLLDAVKAHAEALDVPYQRFIRAVLERAVTEKSNVS